MRTVVVDKIASVTQACGLGNEVRVATDNIPAEEGVVVVVEILTNKSTYNTLELTSGRMAKVGKGDIVAGALGHRKALFGYSGHVPESVKPGDIIQMLNIGGVLGVVDSVNPDKGKPFDCRVIGGVLHFPYLGERIGVPARVGYRQLDFDAKLVTNGVPVVALAGTCMEAGKTAAAAAIISRMRHRGLVVDAFKATGVSLRRDIMAFEDAGARNTLIFTDFGIVSTTRKVGPALTRTMLTELSEKKPDVIVFELGDGLFGTYGVDSILEQDDLRKAFTGVVLSANDPVAAYGGVDILRKKYGIEPIAVTGPSTDNDVGVSIIRDQLKVPAFNALAAGAALGDSIIQSVGLTQARALDRAANEVVMSSTIPAIVLGGTGYVSGELLRLILGHPVFSLAGVMSDSSPGELAGKSFPHLAGALGSTAFKSQADISALIAKERTSAVFCAAPHGAAAALIDSLLEAAEAAGTKPRFVDISADFRFATASGYEAV